MSLDTTMDDGRWTVAVGLVSAGDTEAHRQTIGRVERERNEHTSAGRTTAQ
jgi:hypothetical protein